MSDRNDRKPDEYGGLTSEGESLSASSHLAEELLNSYLDGECSPSERSLIDSHIASCANCQTRLQELRGTQLLLKGLPTPALRRSFQLTPASVATSGSIWNRFGSWLLPGLPALRTAAIAIALLFVAVTVRNTVTDTSNSGLVSDTAMILQATETPVLSTATGNGRNTAQIESNQVQPTASTVEEPVQADPNETAPDADAPANVAVEETDTASSNREAFADSAPVSAETPTTDTLPSSTNDTTSPAMESSLADESTAAEIPSDAAAKSFDQDLDDEASSEIAGDGESAGAAAGSNESIAAETGGASESAFAMIAPSSPVNATQRPASPPAATPLPASQTPGVTTTRPVDETPAAAVTPLSNVQTAPEDGDGSSVWNVLQIALGLAAGALLILVIVLHRWRKFFAKTAF